MTQDIHTTDDGTEYTTTGGRAVVPTPDHEFGGGVTLDETDASAIVNAINCGATAGETGSHTEWELTGTTTETRVGESKDLRITQTSFGREREVTLTLVDVADLELVARDAGA